MKVEKKKEEQAVLDKKILKERALHYAQKQDEVILKGERVEFFQVRLNKETYLIDMPLIEEVVSPERISKLPKSKPFMLGVMNVRGELVLLLDLAALLGLPKLEETEKSKVIVLKSGSDRTGMVVDQALGSLKIDTGEQQTHFSHSKGDQTDWIKGLFQHEGVSKIWLDIPKILREVTDQLNNELEGNSSID